VPGTNGGTTAFNYDPFGRRIYKSSPSFSGIFIYDGPNVIETVNTSGVTVSTYAMTQSTDEPLAAQQGGVPAFYEADALGSLTSLSGPTGALQNTYAYGSFGTAISVTGSSSNTFRYTGREFDQETGLYYYRARYYDPSTGRFLSEDPIGLAGGLNFYSYAQNRPVTFKDPSGKCVNGIDTIVCIVGGVVVIDIYVGYLNYSTSLQNVINLANNYTAALGNVQRVCDGRNGDSPEACQDAIDLAAQTKCNLLLGVRRNLFTSLTLPGTFIGGDAPSGKGDLVGGAIQDQIDQEAERELDNAEKNSDKGRGCCSQ
jgi:RHS repeat-associated protein